MTDRPWRTRKLIEEELVLAERGRRRVIEPNKALYNGRIKELKAELEALKEKENA